MLRNIIFTYSFEISMTPTLYMGKQKLHRQRKPHSTSHGAPALSIAPACLVPSLARKITPLFPLGLSEGTVLCVLRITGPSPLGGCFLT